MAVETLIKQLLEAGVHFGHQTKRWNPRTKEFIFGEKSGIYIIDLQQTARRLKSACDFLKTLASEGKNVVFVGTKKQAQEIISFEAARCGMFYVNERWLGGTLTNFETIRKSVQRLREMQALRAPESSASLTKKEKSVLDKEIARLKKKLSGVVEMEALPAALVVVDPKKEEIAVAEARRLSIPVVALLDTNCDPEGIEYPVPGNDDALKAIKFVIAMLADNILAGREKYVQEKELRKVKASKKEPKPAEEKPQAASLEETSAEAGDSTEEDATDESMIENLEKKLKEEQQPHIRRRPKTEKRS